MTNCTDTHRLVEHRYGRTLDQLRSDSALAAATDPVLPVILRRLDDLGKTEARLGEASLRLETAVEVYGPANDLVTIPYAQNVLELQRQRETEAKAVWDLLDVRLLLDRTPAITPRAVSCRTAPAPASPVDELLPAACEIATSAGHLSRSVLRRGLRARGIRASNDRLGEVLRHLRGESSQY